MRCSVTAWLGKSEFSEPQAKSVLERIGADAIASTAGLTSRTIGCLVEAESLDQAVQLALDRIQAALGDAGVTGTITQWRGEELVTKRGQEHRVIVGSSPFRPIGRGRRGPDGGSGEREPLCPLPNPPGLRASAREPRDPSSTRDFER